MTDAETRLWSKLRLRQLNGFQFYRQRIINNYIVDFYAPRAKLVIEVDGGQHYSKEGAAKDKERDNYLSGKGLMILRYSDTEVLTNIEGVVDDILRHLK
jgi:very-short-patch-repair endonuclease